MRHHVHRSFGASERASFPQEKETKRRTMSPGFSRITPISGALEL